MNTYNIQKSENLKHIFLFYPKKSLTLIYSIITILTIIVFSDYFRKPKQDKAYSLTMDKKSPKYNQLLSTAKKLFWKFGIKRVSIEEICRESNVSKMTFYKYFRNKKDLALKVVEILFDDIEQDYHKLMNENTSFEEKIKKQLQMKFEGTREISAEIVKDIYGDLNSEIHKYWEKRAGQMMQQVLEDYQKAQEAGWIRKDVNLHFFMAMSNKAVEMVNDKHLQAMYPDMQSLIMEIANLMFYGILTEPDYNSEKEKP